MFSGKLPGNSGRLGTSRQGRRFPGSPVARAGDRRGGGAAAAAGVRIGELQRLGGDGGHVSLYAVAAGRVADDGQRQRPLPTAARPTLAAAIVPLAAEAGFPS